MANDASPSRVSSDWTLEAASPGVAITTPMLADNWCSTSSTAMGRLRSSRMRAAISPARSLVAT